MQWGVVIAVSTIEEALATGVAKEDLTKVQKIPIGVRFGSPRRADVRIAALRLPSRTLTLQQENIVRIPPQAGG